MKRVVVIGAGIGGLSAAAVLARSGFDATVLQNAWGSRLGRNLWLVGDSIFPGQSVAATALGGMWVAGVILRQQRAALPEASMQLKGVA